MLKKILLAFFLICFDVSAKELKIVYAGFMRDITDSSKDSHARLSTLLNGYKNKDQLVFLYGGNGFGPSIIGQNDKGAHIVHILNILKPDALGIGHSDLMYSGDELSLRASESNFPFILSNVGYKNGDSLFDILPYIIIEKNGFKIGVISAIEREAKYMSKTSDLKIENLLSSTRRQSKILKKKGADIIILLTTGHEKEPSFLLKNKDVDLILSKYIHTPIKNYTHHHFINLPTKDSVAIVTLFEENKKVNFDTQIVTLKNYEPDEKIRKIANIYIEQSSQLQNIHLGYINTEINTKRALVRSRENSFANLVTDAIKEHSKADLVFLNGGAIRGNKIYKSNKVSVTKRFLSKELPFKNKIILLKIKGKYIQDAIKYNFKKAHSDSGKFLHISGGSIEYDSSSKEGDRLKKIFIDKKPLDLNKTYKLAVVDFLYNEGDGFKMLNNSERIYNYELDNK